MFIAHLPAGYMCARLLNPRADRGVMPALVLAGMAGGIFPDIDLIYGALVDGGRVHHHLYWPHLPLVWAGVSLLFLLVLLVRRRPGGVRRGLCGAFIAGAWSHVLLDTVAGDIWWLWPWLDTPYSLVHIPAIHTTWWLNYLLHWSFVAELAIVILALVWEGLRPVLRRRTWRPA